MNADAHVEAAATAKHMQQALESRKTIDMALGILIATHHCSPERAFAILSQASQRHNRKLRELAEDLVKSEVAASRTRRENPFRTQALAMPAGFARVDSAYTTPTV